MGTPHVLRVALVEGPRIIEDRTLAPRASLTVGTDGRNTVVTPLSHWPEQVALISFRKGAYRLSFSTDMRGRVWLNGAEHTLEQLVERGLATPERTGFSVVLQESSRGRVAMGDSAVMFQFVKHIAPPAPLELPPEARGSFLGQFDRLFVGVMAVSLVVHFSGALYASSQPSREAEDVPLEEVGGQFQRVVMAIPKAKPVPVTDTPTIVGKVPTEAPKQVARPAAAPRDFHAAVQGKGMLAVIGAKTDGTGAIDNLLKDFSNDRPLTEMIDGTSRVATNDFQARKGDGVGDRRVETVTVETHGVKAVGIGEHTDLDVHGTVHDEGAQPLDATDIPTDELSRYVRARKTAIVSCYERELKRNPSLHGKLTLRFDITEKGRVTGVGFSEDTLGNADVESCIKALVANWITPFHPDEQVPVAFPFVFSPSR